MLTTGLLIAGICVLLAVFSLINQGLEQKRTEKRLLCAGLERHGRHLQGLLAGFPPGYLNKKLVIFLAEHIIGTYEKLSQLDSNPTYRTIQKNTREALKAQSTLEGTNLAHESLKTPQQIKEIKELLKSLMAVIATAVQNHELSSSQANQFKQELNNTMLIVNLDGYHLAAQQAESTDKLQVAIHYHEQAKKLLLASTATDKKQKIEHYDRLIKGLSDKLSQQASALIHRNLENTPELDGAASQPHIAINHQLDPFKKKQVYD